MRIVICEDNDVERLLLRTALEELGYKDAVEFCACEDLLIFLKCNRADVVLLDIGMPGMSGMELATMIRRNDESIYIIFITAYEHFAMDAFEVYASDYIVKPLNKERLKGSLGRVKRYKSDGSFGRILQVRNRDAAYSIREEDIIFIEKYLYKSIINTEDGVYEVSMSLKKLEQILDPSVFCRTHNGFIVNKTKVLKLVYTGNMAYTIHFKNTKKTAILSRSKRDVLLNEYNG